MTYTTKEAVKAYAGIGSGEDDTLIAQMVDAIDAAINAYCHRTLVATSDTTRYFTVGRDTEGFWLWFDDCIASITTVTNGDSVVVSSSEYVTSPANEAPYHGIKILSSAGKAWTYSTDPDNAISVAGKWGYFAAVPDDVEQAAKRWVTFLYRQKDTSVDIDRPLLTDSGVTIMPAQAPNDVKQLLAPYRRL